MGTPQGKGNSTRLSLDIADLPLTPFGMSPRGSSKKLHTFPAQRSNKLSLKTHKPTQDNKQVTSLAKENKENRDISSHSRHFRQQFSRTSIRNTPSNLQTLHENCSSDFHTNSVDTHEPPALESSEATVGPGTLSRATVPNRMQIQRICNKESERRESIFTDIDEDGSFIEFCYGKEEGQPVIKLNEDQGRNPPQLYYTCESQNETQFSTSTKFNNAEVGFRKYVEAVKKQKELLNIIKEKEVKLSKVPVKSKNFNCDDTIITCSANYVKTKQPKNSMERVVNSTVIDKHPSQIQISRSPVFPDISTLTIPTVVVSSSDSGSPTPGTSPKYLQRRKFGNDFQPLVVLESSDDDSINERDVNERIEDAAGIIKLKNILEYKNRHSEARLSDYNKTSPQKVQKEAQSLISEDVSIVTSVCPTRHQLRKPIIGTETDPVGSDCANSVKEFEHSPVKDCNEHQMCEDECDAEDDTNYDADCEEFKATGSPAPEKYIEVTPDTAKNPAVAKWIITSPFKESSFGSSFLQKTVSFNVSGSPSQTNLQTTDIINSSITSENSFGNAILGNIKKSKKTFSVSKAMKSPLFIHNRHRDSGSSDSEVFVKIKRSGIPSRVVDSTSEDSSDDSRRRASKPKRKLNSFMKKTASLSLADNIDESLEESLHLRLSEGLSKSYKTMEKTSCTIGRDATSPNTVRKSYNHGPVSENLGESVKVQKSRNVMRIIDSDDHISSDSLPDLEINLENQDCKLGPKASMPSMLKTNSQNSDSKSSGSLDLRRIQDELDHIYSSDWRKNECAVMKNFIREVEKSSVTKRKVVENTVGGTTSKTTEPMRRKEEIQRTLCFETDDEETDEENNTDQESEALEDGDTGKEYDETKNGVPGLPKRKNKAADDSFEIYLQKVKSQTEKDKKLCDVVHKHQDQYESSFINDESEEDISYTLPPLTQRAKKFVRPGYIVNSNSCGSISEDLRSLKIFEEPKKTVSSATSSSSWRDSPTIAISSNSDSDEVFSLTEVKKKLPQPSLTLITPKPKGRSKIFPKTEGHCQQLSRRYETSGANNATPTLSFLASLSTNVHTGRCHPEAFGYTKNFKKQKEELSEKLYKYYNTHVFEGKLPSSMSIKWNARMTKTAGFCYYQIDRSKAGRGTRIELSTKVIDAPERLRDTLIHELCHAAAWIISGYKDGHGPLWKAWAAKAMHTFPELPRISRCHSYEITCKYTYRCTRCKYSIGRHSKSLDIEKKVCGYCYGRFELVINSQRGHAKSGLDTPAGKPPKTPRTPGAFAIFVKENYGSVKKSRQNIKHADVMKVLSEEFGKMKANNK
ncbi:uncharacterized protein LOC121867533 [Homarus americanus]|uniref:Acidic repeat-containing protein-like n=1 Tax=Homarus americanus TaxID=6706 RepID=A0A8J5KEB4_HOMAM|nr:uncharacterized protein LOC121867533 [Homarus americanus]KAG7168219.1 Acidic repeat-containing protein-like [Homarus americanus]